MSTSSASRVCLLVLGLVLAVQGNAAEEPLVRIPFQQTGNHTFIRLKPLFSSDTLDFVFDTGAGSTVIAEGVFAKASAGKGPGSKKQLEGAGGFENASTLDSAGLCYGAMQLDHLTLYSFNAVSLSESIGRKIDGVIGADILLHYQVFINYKNSTLDLYNFSTPVNIAGDVLPMELVENIPVIVSELITARGRRIKARLYFDSGSGLSLILNTPFVQQHGLAGEIDRPITYKIQGMGAASSSLLTTYRSLAIGQFIFDGVPVSLSRSTQGVSAAADIDGILGNDLIKRFSVLLNYAEKKLTLVPNEQYSTGFKRHYSGARYKIREGRIFVDAILSHSPAEAAGLRPGDVIISANGQKFSDIEAFRRAVDAAGRKQMLVIERSGKALQLVVNPKAFY